MTEKSVRDWLLEGDPAIRWRVVDPSHADQERARIATEGWGRRLLAEQSADGSWGGGPYAPKWTSTTYTLLHLLWLGLLPGDSAALRGCASLWEWQAGWKRTDTCIQSMLVRLSSYFGDGAERCETVVQELLDQQLDDGGWNCAARGGETAKHSSFHTSIQVLEALSTYARTGGAIETGPAQQRGREFFLRHALYKSHRTGEVAIRQSVRFPAFPEWHFDVLRGLEYFAAIDAPQDDRLRDAIEVLCATRRRDGRWHTYAGYAGRQWFPLEPSGPSRWTTMRAVRVLAWWSGDGSAIEGFTTERQ